MYTDRANPNAATPIRMANAISTSDVSPNTAAFSVSSVSSSHEVIATSELFTYPQVMHSAAYILAQLTPKEEKNLFNIIDSRPISEQHFALQELAFAEQAYTNLVPASQSIHGLMASTHQVQPQINEATTSSLSLTSLARTVHDPSLLAQKENLLDILEIDLQEKDEFLHDLTTALKETELKASDEIKVTVVKSLLEGKNEKQIVKECKNTAIKRKRATMYLTKSIILSMFEYYKLGGLTLLKGHPHGRQDPLPAKLMHQALTIYQSKHCQYTEILRTLRSEIKQYPEYSGKNIPVIGYKRIIKFLTRCGVTAPKWP